MISGAEFETVDGYTITLADDAIPFERIVPSRDIRSTEQERSQEHGIWPTPTFLGKMVVTMEGDILADDSEGYNLNRLALLRAFYPREISISDYIGTLKLSVDGISERLTCRVGLEGWPEIPLEALSPAAGKYHIAVKAFDPRFYGETINQVTSSAPTETIVGRTYPKTYPYTYGYTAYPTGTQIVTNAGNAESAPIVTIYGPGSNPIVTMIIGSYTYEFIVEEELVSGDVVIVNLADHTAELNSENIYNSVTGDYWKLPPGDAEFSYAASIGTTTASSRAILSWQNSYVY